MNCSATTLRCGILVAVMVAVFPSIAYSFDQVSYVIREDPHGGQSDTLGMIAFQSEPKLGATTQIDVEWYLDFVTEESISIHARGGSACAFLWDKVHHVWPGPHGPGEVLRATFEITPILVGKLYVRLEVLMEPHGYSWFNVPITLNEKGILVEDSPELTYGKLGPSPDAECTDLYFVYGCYQSSINKLVETICMRGKLPLPLHQGVPTVYECAMVPTCDFSQGVYFQVDYDDILDVELIRATDWPNHVSAGDSLRVQLAITPIRPGIGTIDVRAWGFNPVKDPTHRLGVDNGGRDINNLRAILVIDEDFRVVANSTGQLPDSSMDKMADFHRLQDIWALRTPIIRSTLSSENFESVALPLDYQLRRERRH